MSFTSGFFNAINHDRTYDALQVSQLFDGLIRDGIFASIGTCFVVVPNHDFTVNVGIGRAWFDHTWSYNDAIMPVDLPPSEILLNRIDAVVLEVNLEESVRKNSIKVIKGTPGSNPVKPALTKSTFVKQYPLAYITQPEASSRVEARYIENCVGTDSTPFVTGILEVISMDQLLQQWRAQMDHFIKTNTDNFNNWFATIQAAYAANWQAFLKWEDDSKAQFQGWQNTTKSEFNTWQTNTKNEFTTWQNNTKNAFVTWQNTTKNEFNTWQNNTKSEYDEWFQQAKDLIMDWFNNLVDTLGTNPAVNLQLQIDALTELQFKRYYGLIAGTTDWKNAAIVTNDTYGSVRTTIQKPNLSTVKFITAVEPKDGDAIYTKTVTTENATASHGYLIGESFTVQYKAVPPSVLGLNTFTGRADMFAEVDQVTYDVENAEKSKVEEDTWIMHDHDE